MGGHVCPNDLFLFLQGAVAPRAGAGPSELRSLGRVAWLWGRPAPSPLVGPSEGQVERSLP